MPEEGMFGRGTASGSCNVFKDNLEDNWPSTDDDINNNASSADYHAGDEDGASTKDSSSGRADGAGRDHRKDGHGKGSADGPGHIDVSGVCNE